MSNFDIPKFLDTDKLLLYPINSNESFKSIRILVNGDVVPRLTGFKDYEDALKAVFLVSKKVKVYITNNVWFEYKDDPHGPYAMFIETGEDVEQKTIEPLIQVTVDVSRTLAEKAQGWSPLLNIEIKS